MSDGGVFIVVGVVCFLFFWKKERKKKRPNWPKPATKPATLRQRDASTTESKRGK